MALFTLLVLTFASLSPLALATDKAKEKSHNAALATPPAASVDSITPTELKLNLSFLASEEFGGRYTLSPQFLVAAKYLATRLDSYGYKGASNGSFFQKFDISKSKVDPANTKLSLTLNGENVEIAFGDFLTNAPQSGSAEGKIVFVGYGVSAPKQGHDDYAGLDVKGKIVFYVRGTPKGMDASKIDDSEQGMGAAKAHGAVGTISLLSQNFLRFMSAPGAKERIMQREITGLADAGKNNIPDAVLMPSSAAKLLNMVGMTSDKAYETAAKHDDLPASKELNASASLKLTVNRTLQTVQNVTGYIEGTDPKLKNEYVVFSGHYDHLETRNGKVYPGADDDGSGTVSTLAISRAMSMNPPKRSVLIIFHAGEELGLLGSEYNTDYSPVVPLDKLVVDLNIDMIGREQKPGDKVFNKDGDYTTPPDGVFVVGTNRISKELHEISETTNKDYAHLQLDYHYNNPNDPSRIYFRSDHWNYAKHGVPIIFYFTGVHDDYHQPTDTVDKIDFDKMAHIAKFVYETGWRVANLDHRLAIDAK